MHFFAQEPWKVEFLLYRRKVFWHSTQNFLPNISLLTQFVMKDCVIPHIKQFQWRKSVIVFFQKCSQAKYFFLIIAAIKEKHEQINNWNFLHKLSFTKITELLRVGWQKVRSHYHSFFRFLLLKFLIKTEKIYWIHLGNSIQKNLKDESLHFI